MEILLEVILDIVLEGSIEIASDKKVPLPIQIVGTIIIAMVYFGILGLLLYLGIHNASMYWLARMLEAGEDPLYVARRVTWFASEDVGLAGPHALEVAVAAYQTCHFIGMPECAVHLTEAVVYLALAPKSNALYVAYEKAKQDAIREMAEPVPIQLRNAPTKLMKDLEYGKDYQYAHDSEEKLTNMQCLPDSLLGTAYYVPTDQGRKSAYQERLQQIKEWKAAHET